jgi:TPR repeat protein
MTMKASDCWAEAYKFIADGETEKAVSLCEGEPCSGAVECQRFLGWNYYRSDDFTKALDWFSKAAEAGDGDALFGMGSICFVRRDFHNALRYYKDAADRGCLRAYAWIGYIYHRGLGVPRNENIAISYYKQGASKGSLIAQRALIHLAWRGGKLLAKIAVLPKYVYVIVKAGIIAYRDVSDPRIADIPNVLERKPPASRVDVR